MIIDAHTKVVFLDTETTGLSPGRDRIVELGVVFDGLDGSNYRRALVNPERSIPHEVVVIHGIDDEAIKKANAKTWVDILPGVMKFIPKDTMLVIHNARFDLSLMYVECARAGEEALEWLESLYAVDTLDSAKKQFPNKRKGLTALANMFDVEYDEDKRHTAVEDCQMLHGVWHKWRLGLTGNLYNKDVFEPRPVIDFVSPDAKSIAIGILREKAKAEGRVSPRVQEETPLPSGFSPIVVGVPDDDQAAHELFMARIKEEAKASGNEVIWSSGPGM